MVLFLKEACYYNDCSTVQFSSHLDSAEVLIDPHIHSKYSDGLSSPRRVFIRAQRRGLRGAIITDHDTVRQWDECLEMSKRAEISTTLGVEISTAQGHLLSYFDCTTPARRVARALKLDQGMIYYLDVESVIRRVHDLGGIACVPHPFGPFYPLGSKFFDLVDGIEEYNSWIFQDNKRFRNAFGFAKKYKVAALGGSDSHYPYTIGFGATGIPATVDLNKPDWFLRCVRERMTRPVVQQTPVHRRINFIKSTVSIPLNVRYNAKFFRSKWEGYWKQNYRTVLKRGLKTAESS